MIYIILASYFGVPSDSVNAQKCTKSTYFIFKSFVYFSYWL